MKCSTKKEFLQPIGEYGMVGMGEVSQHLFNSAMKLERENALKAALYQLEPVMPTASRNAVFKQELANLTECGLLSRLP